MKIFTWFMRRRLTLEDDTDLAITRKQVVDGVDAAKVDTDEQFEALSSLMDQTLVALNEPSRLLVDHTNDGNER